MLVAAGSSLNSHGREWRGSARDAFVTRFPVALQAVDPSTSSALPIPKCIHDGMIDLLVEGRRT